MLQAIIFDYNGVLINDLNILENAYLEAARELELPLSSKTVREFISYAPDQKRRLFFGDISDEQWEQVVRLRTRFYFEKAENANLVIPNVDAVLTSLSTRYTLALISNTIRTYFEHTFPPHLSALFKETLFVDEVSKPKPSPEPLFEMLKRLQVRKKQCCYVGDSILDIRMSKSAGISVFAVATGGNSKKELKEAGADCVMASLEDLEAKIEPSMVTP
jgi:phosphoglycolate phosphatase